MGFADSAAYYRNALNQSIKIEDKEGAVLNATMYARLLRKVAGQVYGYVDRAFLNNEAEWYEAIAIIISNEGVSDKVKDILKNEIGKRKVSPSVDETLISKPSIANPFENSKKETGKEPLVIRKKGEDEGVTPPNVAPVTSIDAIDWFADVFERRLPATVVVTTDDSAGTGFFISEDGLIVTNHHVVYSGRTVSSTIEICSGDEKIQCEVKFIDANKERDVALLKADLGNKKAPFVPMIKDYSKVRPGMSVMMIGNAFDCGLAPISGMIKFPRAKMDDNLVYTAPSNSGDSGGPLFDRDGNCIGIHKSSTESVSIGNERIKARGLANATPAEDILKLVEKWKEKHGL